MVPACSMDEGEGGGEARRLVQGRPQPAAVITHKTKSLQMCSKHAHVRSIHASKKRESCLRRKLLVFLHRGYDQRHRGFRSKRPSGVDEPMRLTEGLTLTRAIGRVD